jgi:hypothetical protein
LFVDNVIITSIVKDVNQFVIFLLNKIVVARPLTEGTEPNGLLGFEAIGSADFINHSINHLFFCCLFHLFHLFPFDDLIIACAGLNVNPYFKKFFWLFAHF